MAGAVVDGSGVAYLVIGVTGLILSAQIPVSGVSAVVAIVLAAMTMFGAAGTMRRVVTCPNGMLPAAIVRQRRLRPWWIAAAGTQAGQFSALFLLPALFHGRFGRSPLVIGVVLALHAPVGVVVAKVLPAWLDDPRATRAVSAIALALAAGLVGVSLLGPSPPVLVAVTALAFAVFTAAQVVAVDEVCGAVPDDLVGPATGILSLVFLAGGAAGAALTSVATDRWSPVAAGWVAAIPPLLAGIAVLFASRHPTPTRERQHR